MLEERLLNMDYDIKTELKNLENLKKRFGEANLHTCDVMLKDIKESDRVRMQLKSDAALKVTILSKGYWD